jgi:hypothetical protein
MHYAHISSDFSLTVLFATYTGSTFRAQVVRVCQLKYRFGAATGNSCLFISVSARGI